MSRMPARTWATHRGIQREGSRRTLITINDKIADEHRTVGPNLEIDASTDELVREVVERVGED